MHIAGFIWRNGIKYRVNPYFVQHKDHYKSKGPKRRQAYEEYYESISLALQLAVEVISNPTTIQEMKEVCTMPEERPFGMTYNKLILSQAEKIKVKIREISPHMPPSIATKMDAAISAQPPKISMAKLKVTTPWNGVHYDKTHKIYRARYYMKQNLFVQRYFNNEIDAAIHHDRLMIIYNDNQIQYRNFYDGPQPKKELTQTELAGRISRSLASDIIKSYFGLTSYEHNKEQLLHIAQQNGIDRMALLPTTRGPKEILERPSPKS